MSDIIDFSKMTVCLECKKQYCWGSYCERCFMAMKECEPLPGPPQPKPPRRRCRECHDYKVIYNHGFCYSCWTYKRSPARTRGLYDAYDKILDAKNKGGIM